MTLTSPLRRRAAGALLAAWVAGCAAPPPRAPTPAAPPPEDRVFLAGPASGYPLAVDPRRERALTAAHAALAGRGDRRAARAAAEELLAADPALHPAIVLLAQSELVEGRFQEAVDRLRPVVAEFPGYVAAELAYARAAEKLGDLPTALGAYTQAGAASRVAAQRAAAVRPRALEIVGERLAEALRRGRADEAAAQLTLLERWAPDEEVTLRGAQAVAAARCDPAAELAAVRRLVELHPRDRELTARRGELEVTAGDAGAGVQIFERLAREHPEDARLAERLSWAKYRWRLQLLPAEIAGLAGAAQLSRADLAALLYWLLPEVRYGRGASPRIATDVLEHPRRDEVVRVVNLGLLDLDETLHQFHPQRPATRADALRALLRLLALRGGACAQGAGGRGPGAETACALAAGCGLLPSAADCLPGAPLAGGEAVEMVRRASERLAAR